MKLPTDTDVFQNSWVVDDIEAAAMEWVTLFNIGPFFIGEYSPKIISEVTYRGAPGELNMLVGLAQAGAIQIELIQPVGDKPNCYRDVVKPGETMLHHVCVWTDDLDADLAYYQSKGCEIANTGRVTDNNARFGYVDTYRQLNCMIEILEHNDSIKAVFKMIADTCSTWDGKDPIRHY